jgi:demethylmenaquinone methyltransferase/2-methoxy-6-polyprenyl-1,4-benzoquinol methylase
LSRPELSGLLGEQQDYYRAAAPEYDANYGADSPLGSAARALDFIGIRGDTLELASGTGQWSRLLETRAEILTCLDAAPSTIEVARSRVGEEVEFIIGDVFSWRPGRLFDTVFFAFWLSHVPRRLWASFWGSVAGMLAPGGVVGVIDETAEAVIGKEQWTAEPEVASRQLSDGRRFEIVKLQLVPDDVVAELHRLGWTAAIDYFHPGSFALRAIPTPTARQ